MYQDLACCMLVPVCRKGFVMASVCVHAQQCTVYVVDWMSARAGSAVIALIGNQENPVMNGSTFGKINDIKLR